MIESTLFQYPDNVHQTKDRTRTQVLFDGRQFIIVCQSTNIRFKYCHYEDVYLPIGFSFLAWFLVPAMLGVTRTSLVDESSLLA